MAGDLFHLNRSRARFVNLSRSYGELSAVKIGKRDMKTFRMDSRIVEVGKMTSHIAAVRAVKELKLKNTDKESGLRLIEQKFQNVLPNVSDMLKNVTEEKESIPYFTRKIPYFDSAVRILAEGLGKLQGEPWIEMTEGLEPLKITKKDEVLQHYESIRKDKLFSIIFLQTLFGTSLVVLGASLVHYSGGNTSLIHLGYLCYGGGGSLMASAISDAYRYSTLKEDIQGIKNT